MCSLTDRDYETLASAFAFLGNSLLEPMTKTPDVGLKAEFWKEFPTFGDAEVEAALDAMRRRPSRFAPMSSRAFSRGRRIPKPRRGKAPICKTATFRNAVWWASAKRRTRCAACFARLGLNCTTKTTSTKTIWASSCCFYRSCAVHEAAPDGYFDNLLKVAKALLEVVAR